MTPAESDYRWIVRIKDVRGLGRDYAREVTTDGPHPDEAVRLALAALPEENDLWHWDSMQIAVERVR